MPQAPARPYAGVPPVTPIRPQLDPASELFAARKAATEARVARLRGLELRAAAASARGTRGWSERGKLSPRERLARLLDPARPFLPLATLAGWCVDDPDPETSIPGGSQLAGIGYVAGVRCVIVATDAGIAG